VAAPVTALQPATPCSIRFRPALPQLKQRAVDTLKIGNTVKVFVAFERRFWPEGLFDVACVGCFLPVGPSGICFCFCPNVLCFIPQIQSIMLELCRIMPNYSD